MRKVEQDMVNAILAGKTFKSSNTKVERFNGGLQVYLHGNHIATVTGSGLAVGDGGWRSNTTKSRLNALIHGLCAGNNGIYQKNFQWYATIDGLDAEWHEEWLIFSRASR